MFPNLLMICNISFQLLFFLFIFNKLDMGLKMIGEEIEMQLNHYEPTSWEYEIKLTNSHALLVRSAQIL